MEVTESTYGDSNLLVQQKIVSNIVSTVLTVMHLSMVCPRTGGRGCLTLGNLSSNCSTREGIFALISIPFLPAILKNYREIIGKSFQKGREIDTKFRPKGVEIVL